MSVHYCNSKPTNRTMNTPTPTPRTDAKQKLKDIIGDEYVAVDFARQLERELTAAREELDKAIEERREETMKATAAISGLEMWKRCSQDAEKELATVMYQRDRLAEALKKVVTSWDEATWLDDNEFESFREALQSLNPDHTVATNDMIPAVKGGGDE